MRRDCCWFGMGLLTLVLAVPGRAEEVQAKPGPEQVEFFETKVRPVLADHCLECHGPEKQKGGLRLDSPDAMRTGGDSGPAIVAGRPGAEPADRGDPLRRADPDAAQGEARRRRDRRADRLGEAGAPWPSTGAEAATAATAQAWTDHRRGPRLLGVPAGAGPARAGREGRRLGRSRRSTASSSRGWRRRGSARRRRPTSGR